VWAHDHTVFFCPQFCGQLFAADIGQLHVQHTFIAVLARGVMAGLFRKYKHSKDAFHQGAADTAQTDFPDSTEVNRQAQGVEVKLPQAGRYQLRQVFTVSLAYEYKFSVSEQQKKLGVTLTRELFKASGGPLEGVGGHGNYFVIGIMLQNKQLRRPRSMEK
jgi:hypothetical protein